MGKRMPADDDHYVLRLLTGARRSWLAGRAQRRANMRDRVDRVDRRDRVDRPVIRWKMSSRMAAPMIAVSQVEALKNPCKVWHGTAR